MAPIDIAAIPIPVFRLDPTAPTLDDATAARLQAAIGNRLKWDKIPGMSAAVVFPDGRVWTGTAGVGVIASHEPVTVDTKFSVASISKTFVAALTLKLATEGVLSLDDPVSRFVPSYPNAANVTIRQLLTHTSGLRDLFKSPGMSYEITVQPHKTWTPQEVLDRIGAPYFAPGAGYHYSNTNYVLLGVVIERATGVTLASLIRKDFLEPLGMTNTLVQTEEPLTGTYAHGYGVDINNPKDLTEGSTMIPFDSETTACSSACEVASTPTDLARWATALYGGGILDDASLALMVDTSQNARWHPPFHYAMGMEEYTLGSRVAWGHQGHLDGFWSVMLYLPAEHISIVATTNAEWASPLLIAGDMLAAIHAKP